MDDFNINVSSNPIDQSALVYALFGLTPERLAERIAEKGGLK